MLNVRYQATEQHQFFVLKFRPEPTIITPFSSSLLSTFDPERPWNNTKTTQKTPPDLDNRLIDRRLVDSTIGFGEFFLLSSKTQVVRINLP